MINESWKAVEGFEGIYEISSEGRLRNVKGRVNVLKPCADNRGYLIFILCDNNRRKTARIHRLVAKAFIPNTFNNIQVNHKNGIKTDNRVENLEWCTPLENTQHSIKNGFKKVNGFKRQPGESNGFSKLTDDKVREIRRKYIEDKLTYKQIADEYGVHYSTVGYIMQRKRWAHVN